MLEEQEEIVEAAVSAVSIETRQERIGSYFINGHGPYSIEQRSVPVDRHGIPEACAEDAPLDLACETCRMEFNLRRWMG